MQLESRLAPGSHAVAAYGGLQDSAPRAALFALHARVQGVVAGEWEHPSLVQIWFRRADYVVPRRDVGVFTLGALPRDSARRRALQELADAVLHVLAGETRRDRDVAAAVPALRHPHALRLLSATGKIHIRWDARTVSVVPAAPAEIDEEEARRELARRFLHWLGPATPAQLSAWAGIDRADAAATWQALAGELCPVETPSRSAWARAEDVDELRAGGGDPPQGVRLLPFGDPFLFPHGGLQPPGPPPGLRAGSADPRMRRVLNSLTGRVLVDGAVAGSWGRAGTSFTVAPWRRLTGEQRAALDLELAGTAGPLGAPPVVHWLEP